MMPEPVSITTQPSVAPLKMTEQQENHVATASPPVAMTEATSPPTVARQAVYSTSKQSGGRDSSWLELDVCREHMKDGCPRGELCRFAHPDKSIVSEESKVTCCYDFLKDRCHREHCKYFHPPAHIKDRLVAAGKQFGAMMSGLYTLSIPGTAVPFSPPMGGCVLASPAPPMPFNQYGVSMDRLHICPEYLRGQCQMQLCQFVHPEHYVRRNPDCTVTVCRDFIKSTGCPREQCRYFHPPPHISTQLDAAGGLLTPQGVYVQTMIPPGYQPTGPIMYQPSGPPMQQFTIATSTSSGLATNIPTSNVILLPGSYGHTGSTNPPLATFIPGSYPTGGPAIPMVTSRGLSMFSPPVTPGVATSMSFPTFIQTQTIPSGVNVIDSGSPPLTLQPIQTPELQTIPPQTIVSPHSVQH